MIVAARYGDRRRAPRPFLFAAVVAAHLFAIWLLLRPTPLVVVSADPSFALFDVLPPPLPEPPPPPPPPAPRADDAPTGGGSPGVRRQRPAARVQAPATPAREAMDATLAPLAPPMLPALPAGTALVDLGAGGAGGAGTGTGAGNGADDGDGTGAGDTGDRLARALWVKPPSREAYRRYWPIGRELPNYVVTVRVTCRVRRNGTPYGCRSLSESPARAGFMRMVLGAVTESKVRPVARNGEPMWDVPVIIAITLDRLDTAPPIPLSAAASAPRAR